MLDTPCSEVVRRVLATHCIRQFPPSLLLPCVTMNHHISNGLYAAHWPNDMFICRTVTGPFVKFDEKGNSKPNRSIHHFQYSSRTYWSLYSLWTTNHLIYSKTMFLQLGSAKGCQGFWETKIHNGGTDLLAVLNLYVRVKSHVATIDTNHSVTDSTQAINRCFWPEASWFCSQVRQLAIDSRRVREWISLSICLS